MIPHIPKSNHLRNIITRAAYYLASLLFAFLLLAHVEVQPSASSFTPAARPAPTPSSTPGNEQDAAAQPLPYTGDPVAPQPPPARPALDSRFYSETGHYLSGEFLAFYRSIPNAADLFGLPLSEEFPQAFPDGRIFYVQYFERARFEYHPELPNGQRVQLGLITPDALAGRTFPRLPPLPSTPDRLYFPETGHTLAYAFLSYWKANGGLSIFGFPVSEEMSEDGLTVQYFERARLEYHADLEGTPYAVQLSPVGYSALKATGFNIPMGTLVTLNPPRVAEGHTTVLEVAASPGVTVTGQYEGRNLLFKYDQSRQTALALVGANPFQDTGSRPITITLENRDGGKRTVTRLLEVVSYPYPSEDLQFDAKTAALLNNSIASRETQTLNAIFSGRTPQQYWNGSFEMPLDGAIRITSGFATRRCYNCPNGAPPTTYHSGLDMAAPEGTPVHAPAGGRVVFVGALQERGNTIIIDHGMGVYSLLAHNSKLVATVGQLVQKGDVVALSGNTGLSTGPHVHWEMHVSGPAVEAQEWVKRVMP